MAVRNATTRPESPSMRGPCDRDTLVNETPAVPAAGAPALSVTSVNFMSYNMTGADTVKCQWVRELANEYEVDYCALQEHFKTVKSTEQWFCKQYGDFHTYVVPAYRMPGVDSGRGIGGMVQLALRSTAVPRARLATQSRRLQAQLLTFPTCKVLWVNGYLPCDPQVQTFDDTELVATLAEVEGLITTNNECEVVWAADLNYDMKRDNHFTRTVAAALTRMGLTSLWQGRDVATPISTLMELGPPLSTTFL